MLTSFTNGKKNNKINSREKQWEQYPSECEQSDVPTERENRKRSEGGGENTSECAPYSYLNVSWRTRGVLAFPIVTEPLSRKHNTGTVSKSFSLGGQCL